MLHSQIVGDEIDASLHLRGALACTFWLAADWFRCGRLYCLLFVFYLKKEKEQKRAINKNSTSEQAKILSWKWEVCSFAQGSLQRAWLQVSQTFRVPAWGGCLWDLCRCTGGLSRGSGWSATFCISALWSVPVGDQGPPPTQHTVCGPLCLTVLYEQMRRLWVLRKGSPIAWLSHTLFS